MLFGVDFDAARTEGEETVWVVAEVGDLLVGVEGAELSSHVGFLKVSKWNFINWHWSIYLIS